MENTTVLRGDSALFRQGLTVDDLILVSQAVSGGLLAPTDTRKVARRPNHPRREEERDRTREFRGNPKSWFRKDEVDVTLKKSCHLYFKKENLAP
jgi:hypothetical protein